jgi:hypothetical protein
MQAFTVTKPGGIKGMEDYDAYLRILNRWGVDMTDMPRVLEEGRPNRWLYVFREREDAERFAKEVRAESRNKSWCVREFHTRHLSRGPLGPVVVEVGFQGGCSFGLDWLSHDLIRKRFPHAQMVPGVYIEREGKADFEADHLESIWKHVTLLLTGLTEEELAELGGYRVYDPVNGVVLREPEFPAAPTLRRANAG